MVSTTLVVHCLKTLLGHVVQFDWKKSGTKQLLHSHLTLHLFPNNLQAWGFWREGAWVLSGAGPCGHRIRMRGFVGELGRCAPPPQSDTVPSLQGTSDRASHEPLDLGFVL